MLPKRFCIATLCLLAITGNGALAADSPPAEPVTLLTMLREWEYPGFEFHGAQMSDAGVENISSIKCKAVLTTPDSAEKVVAFYQRQLKVDSSGAVLGQKEGERITTKRAVSIQDDSVGRALKLYVIAVNEKNWSTTLVISRADGEEKTHIAWSNFRQLSP